MIALLDIGNTKTKYALYSGDKLQFEGSFLTSQGVGAAEALVEAEFVLLASVVPAATQSWLDFFSKENISVHIASQESPWGFRIQIENPQTIGLDRLANMEAALAYPGTVLVVDAGTATKFDLLEGVSGVSAARERSFVGGAIAPGMGISYEALLAQTAQLPEVSLDKFSPVIGYNTETAIRSGVLHGFAAQVDGMILKIFEERKLPALSSVVATGGYAKYLQGRAKFITHYRASFTRDGLYALAKKIFPTSHGVVSNSEMEDTVGSPRSQEQSL